MGWREVRGHFDPPWNRGDRVRIVSGPFSEFQGKVEDVNVDQEKLRVIISIFGRETLVEVDFTQVEKAE